MLPVHLHADSIRIGRHCRISFQRTLRIPDDGRTYPLPPGLGRFPIHNVSDFKGRVPSSWLEHGGVFIPMYQREALWLAFDGAHWRPNAMKIAAGKINAVSGTFLDMKFSKRRQDYIVVPDQPWLDGFKSGNGTIRQFIAMPLGMGYTVEGQLTGSEDTGGMQIVVFDPKPGKFPDRAPRSSYREEMVCCCASPAMGIAAGGKINQKVYPDEYGPDTWDEGNYGRLFVHIVNSMMYREITGHEPPATPVTARTYAAHGLPWFDLYDDVLGDVSPSDQLAGVKFVKDMDKVKGFEPQQDDGSVEVEPGKIKKLQLWGKTVDDGKW